MRRVIPLLFELKTSVAATASLIAALCAAGAQAGPDTPPSASVELDLAKVMRQVPLAWRSEEGALVAGHATHRARFSSTGLELTPRVQTAAGRCETPAFAFGAPRLALGEVPLGGSLVAHATLSGETLALDRGAFIEEYENGESGVEVRWRFSRRPRGSGHLRVRIPVLSGTFAGETVHGLHFESGGRWARVGRASWLDRLGRRTDLETSFEGSAIVVEVDAELLAQSAYPAILDPVISPELGMDQPVLLAPRGQQVPAAVASNGQDFLVVWSTGAEIDLLPGLFAARVSAAGVVLDPAGIFLALGDARSGVSAASDGSGYLVVWGIGPQGVRIDSAGRVLDSPPIQFDLLGSNPTLAWSSSQYLLAWEKPSAGFDGDIVAIRLSASAARVDAPPLALSASAGTQTRPRAAAARSGGGFFVVWEDSRSGVPHVFGTRVDADGGLPDPNGLPLSAGTAPQTDPQITPLGSGYLIAWNEDQSVRTDIRASRISETGAVLGDGGFVLASGQGDRVLGQLASLPSASLALFQAYGGGGGQWGQWLTAAGELIDGGVLRFGVNYSPNAAVGGSSASVFLVAVAQPQTGGAANTDDVYATLLPPLWTGDAGFFVVSREPNRQANAAVSWDGQSYLVAWTDRRGLSSDVYGTRVSAAGVVLDPSGIAIATGPGEEANPVAASNGSEHLVVWEVTGPAPVTVLATRISRDGVVLDPNGLDISTAASAAAPAVASDGTDFLAVWEREPTTIGATRVAGARISANGVVLDASDLVISDRVAWKPAVAWTGSKYLVVWEDSRNIASSNLDIYGAHVTTAGAVDSAATPISSAPERQSWPQISSGGGSTLVTWHTDPSSASREVHAVRLGAADQLIDQAPLVVATAPPVPQHWARTAWTGSNHLVVWIDSNLSGRGDIRGARVDPSGARLDPAPLALAASTGSETWPAVACANAACLVAYTRDTGPETFVPRVKATLVSGLDPDGGGGDDGGSGGGSSTRGCGCSAGGPPALASLSLLAFLSHARARRRRDSGQRRHTQVAGPPGRSPRACGGPTG